MILGGEARPPPLPLHSLRLPPPLSLLLSASPSPPTRYRSVFSLLLSQSRRALAPRSPALVAAGPTSRCALGIFWDPRPELAVTASRCDPSSCAALASASFSTLPFLVSLPFSLFHLINQPHCFTFLAAVRSLLAPCSPLHTNLSGSRQGLIFSPPHFTDGFVCVFFIFEQSESEIRTLR